MSILDAFLQGLVQGLTEFLPVSSSGHLSLFQYFTGNSGETGFLFSILLHAGTLIAVFFCFFREIWALICEGCALLRDLVTGKFTTKQISPERKMLFMLLLSLIPLFFMLLLKDWVAGFSTDNDISVEGFLFLLTGLVLIISSRHGGGKKTARDMRSKDALAIGGAQLVATLPGISRSGSTICTGLLCGLDRAYAVSYSFILGIPAVLGAIVLEVKDAISEGLSLPLSVMVVGFVSSAIFGVLAIKLVQLIVKGDKFKYFGYYLLTLGSIVLIIGLIDNLLGHPIQQFLIG